MLPFVFLGGATGTLCAVGAGRVPDRNLHPGKQYCVQQSSDQQSVVAILYVIATCRRDAVSKVRAIVAFRSRKPGDPPVVLAVKEYAFTSLWCAYAADWQA